MNKAELIEAVADATDTSKAEASRTLDAVLDSIAGALSRFCRTCWIWNF